MLLFVRTLALFLLIGLGSQADARRVALVIGNGAYEHAAPLTNPANDAADLAAAFDRLGYEVEMLENATRAQLLDALRGFRRRSLGAEHAVIYYAGHGLEIGRQNYVVPVDAELKQDIDIEYEAVPLSLLVAATSGGKDLQLVVLDACRDNPFLNTMTRTLGTRTIGRGLAVYEPEGNSLVAYSAREGTVALDGEGQNSPYALAFLDALARPGLEIGPFFRQVRDAVIAQTSGQQEPFLYGSLSAEPVFFKPQTPGLPPTPASAPRAPQGEGVSPDTLLAIDLAFWQSIEDSTTASDFEDYIARFPNGQFLSLAKRRLAALKPGTGSAVKPPTAQPETAGPLNEDVKLSRNAARDLQARLNILGFNAGAEDGLIGRKTRAAVVSYGAARGLEMGDTINQALLDKLASEVSAARLASHREANRAARAKAASAPQVTSKPSRPTTTQTSTPPASSFAGYAGRSYCRSKGGQVLNGRNLSDRPIWCITVLSISATSIRYRMTQRQGYGQPTNTSVFSFAKSGARSFGPVRLAANGSGSLTANGAAYVASRIYK